jgi:hypothetical protein
MGQNGFFGELGKFRKAGLAGRAYLWGENPPLRCPLKVPLEIPCGCADTEQCMEPRAPMPRATRRAR